MNERLSPFDPPSKAWHWLLIALFILWLIFSVSSYFVVNKPFDAALPQDVGRVMKSTGFSLVAAGRALTDLAAALWMAIAALGAGLFLWQRLAPAESDPLATLVLSAGLGAGSLGLSVLVLGLLGLLSKTLLIALLLILTLPTLPQTLRLLRKLSWRRPPSLVGLFLFLVTALALTLALMPPTSWDALFYHLKGPKLYLQAGRIQPGVDIPHLNFPSLMEMLFLLGMAIRSDVTAKLVHFLFLFSLSGMIHIIATRSLGLKRGWTALVFLLATPLVPILSAWAYNDLALAYFAAAAIYTFVQWQERNDDEWLRLSGVFAGFMMGLKYTAVVTPLFLIGLVAWHYRKDLRNALRPVLHFAVPAFILVLPWLLKNWAFTGNPVYPFLFGGRFWDGFRSAAYADPGSGIGLNPLALLRLPYDLTLGFADASQEGTIGPFYLIFLPFLLLYGLSAARRKTSPGLRTLLLYAAVSFAFWTFGVMSSRGLWQARLLLPGVVVLCPVLAKIMDDLQTLDHPQFSLQRFLGLAIAFVLILLLSTTVAGWLQVNPLAFLSGGETRAHYLQRRLGAHYGAMEAINNSLPDDAAVSFLWEPRSYYCDGDCRPDSILDKFTHLEQQYGQAQAIAERWREQGITHILLFNAGLEFVLDTDAPLVAPRDIQHLRNLQEHHLSPLVELEDVYTLYALQPPETGQP